MRAQQALERNQVIGKDMKMWKHTNVYLLTLPADLNLFTQPTESQWWSKHWHTPSNALSLGADCVPGVAKTLWLHSATLPPPTVSPQQWLFNKLLARRETTLFNTQMRRQKGSFFFPQGGWLRRERGGGWYTAITHTAFCCWGFLNGGFQSGRINGESDIQLRWDLAALGGDDGAAN